MNCYNVTMIPKHDCLQVMTNVMVYRNLTKGCWSIKSTRTGKVLAHADTVTMTDVVFKVSEAGRQRVLRDKKKYVHAGGYGTCEYFDFNRMDLVQVRYNPFKNSTFVDEFGTPIDSQRFDFVLFDQTGKVYTCHP